jgi:hypothetical protein
LTVHRSQKRSFGQIAGHLISLKCKADRKFNHFPGRVNSNNACDLRSRKKRRRVYDRAIRDLGSNVGFAMAISAADRPLLAAWRQSGPINELALPTLCGQ